MASRHNKNEDFTLPYEFPEKPITRFCVEKKTIPFSATGNNILKCSWRLTIGFGGGVTNPPSGGRYT